MLLGILWHDRLLPLSRCDFVKGLCLRPILNSFQVGGKLEFLFPTAAFLPHRQGFYKTFISGDCECSTEEIHLIYVGTHIMRERF